MRQKAKRNLGYTTIPFDLLTDDPLGILVQTNLKQSPLIKRVVGLEEAE